MQPRTSYFPITYFSSNSLAELLCPISSKSSVASLPAIALGQPLEYRQSHQLIASRLEEGYLCSRG